MPTLVAVLACVVCGIVGFIVGVRVTLRAVMLEHQEQMDRAAATAAKGAAANHAATRTRAKEDKAQNGHK